MQLSFPDNQALDLGVTRVMGILNVTPDSFSDGALYVARDAALARAREMIAEGADIIDVGGESTRPGAEPVAADAEAERVVPVIEALRRESDIPVSVDTSKAMVMEAAVAAGASMINDVRALQEPDSLATAVRLGVPVCLMHMQGTPRTMQDKPDYGDVVQDVQEFLLARAAACEAAGIAAGAIVIDPGFGFGKTLQHNLDLLAGLPQLGASGYPLLAGLSRKSMIPMLMENAGRASGRPDGGAAAASRRIGGSVTLALYAARCGAHIVRVHDVSQTVEALTIQRALDQNSAVQASSATDEQ